MAKFSSSYLLDLNYLFQFPGHKIVNKYSTHMLYCTNEITFEILKFLRVLVVRGDSPVYNFKR
jgi:hypothetical protein